MGRQHLHDFRNDVRYAVRTLRRAPTFSIVAIFTLGVAIGATTAIFSAVNAFLLRPLPFRDPDRLMHVSLTTPDLPGRKGTDDGVWSYPKFLVFRDAQTIFDDLALYSEAQFNIATTGDVERVGGEWITSRYLPTLGLPIQRGRNFDVSHDAHAGAAREVLISDALWRRRFDADPRIIGSKLDVNGEPFSVIGIMPTGFTGLSGQADVFVPITVVPASALGATSHQYDLVARLKAGVTAPQAQSAVAMLGGVVDRAFHDGRIAKGMGAAARRLDDARVAPTMRRSVVILFGAVAFVLLIACVNVANLVLGRADSRRREIAVRLAMGAARGRLVRLLLTESLVLAAAGGALGIAIAWAGIRALVAMNPAAVQVRGGIGGLGVIGLGSIHLDGMALLFTAAVTLAVGVLFGLAPALGATRPSLTSALKGGTGDGRGGRNVVRRWSLVVAEVALSIVLLAGAGLMIRSLVKLLELDPGFDGSGVLTARLALPGGAIARDSLPDFYAQVRDRIAALPGVSAAALGDQLPLSGLSNTTRINLLDRRSAELGAPPSANIARVTPEWFSTLRVPLKRGRGFTALDRRGGPSVVLVNETAARQFWPSGDPVGKRIALNQRGFDEASGGAEVVGVVGDVHSRSDSAAAATVYMAYAQSSQPRTIIFLRTAAEPATLAAPLRAAVREVAPLFPLYDIQTMDARAAAATAHTRFIGGLLGVFSLIALALAAVGIYGVMTVVVGQRRREIGIRIAVGADAGAVVGMMMARSLRVVALGTVLGLGAALALTRLLRAMLYDVSPADPVTYAGIVVVFGLSAALASWLPARRAATVDPLHVLRSD